MAALCLCPALREDAKSWWNHWRPITEALALLCLLARRNN